MSGGGGKFCYDVTVDGLRPHMSTAPASFAKALASDNISYELRTSVHVVTCPQKPFHEVSNEDVHSRASHCAKSRCVSTEALLER